MRWASAAAVVGVVGPLGDEMDASPGAVAVVGPTDETLLEELEEAEPRTSEEDPERIDEEHGLLADRVEDSDELAELADEELLVDGI